MLEYGIEDVELDFFSDSIILKHLRQTFQMLMTLGEKRGKLWSIDGFEIEVIV